MARGTGPLFSLEATGSVGDALTYGKRGRANVIKRKANPSNPRTLPQIQSRAAIAAATELWNTMTDADKQTWEEPATQAGITLYNAFVSYQLKALKANQGPKVNRTGGSAPGTSLYDSLGLDVLETSIKFRFIFALGPAAGDIYLVTLKPDVGGATPTSENTVILHQASAGDAGAAEFSVILEHVPDGEYRLGLMQVGTNGEFGELNNLGLFTKPA